MKTVRDMLSEKNGSIWSVSSESTVYDALKLMAEKEIGALIVIDNGAVTGILSERDYARKVVLHGKFSKDILVKEIMSSHVITVQPNQSLEECMTLMVNKKIRHLLVIENDTMLGIISIGDILHAVIVEKEQVIGQLVNYISGTPQ
jgi:CBS domain-containing protein